MKSILTIVCLGILSNLWSADNVGKLDTLPAVSKVDRNAEFEEGTVAWQIFLTKNIQKDIPAKRGAPLGKYPAMARFVINVDGSIGRIEVARGKTPDYGAGEELARVIKLSSGKWKPGVQNGNAIKVIKVQRLTFEVTDSNDNLKGKSSNRASSTNAKIL